jgi:hypothetical protein
VRLSSLQRSFGWRGVHGFCSDIEGLIRHAISYRARTVLRTGRILTLHP